MEKSKVYFTDFRTGLGVSNLYLNLLVLDFEGEFHLHHFFH